jgi:hypothetical protein
MAGPQDAPAGPKTGGPVAQKPASENTVVFRTDQSRFDPRVNNQGWWATGGDNLDANDNYFVGSFQIIPSIDAVHRNFFTFDVSDLSKHVVSATLRVNSGTVANLAGAEVLRLSDVSTDAATLNENNGQNADIFRDLGTGTVYGEYPVGSSQDNQVLALELNKEAVRDLKHARGGFFSVGGSLLNASRETWIFGGTDGVPVELVVQTR